MIKNKFLLVFLAIAILVPSVVAIVYYSNNKNGEFISTAANTLTLKDTDGETYTFEKEKSDSDNQMIELFLKMETNAQKCVSLPDSVATSPSFTATYKVADRETKFEYYLSRGADNAYYLDYSGNAYQIAAADAAEFLATPYAASIYSESKMPTMTLGGEYRVRPIAAQWMYKNSGGEFVATDVSGRLSDGSDSYSLEGGIAMEFTKEPDNFTIKVTAGGEVIYNDLYSNIGSLHIDPGVSVEVQAEAKWYQDEEREYYGELSYKFSATVAEGAEFYPGVTSIDAGEFISITGVNIKDPTKVTFASEPDIGYTPTFVTDEDNTKYVRALVPFDVNLAAGTYKLTLGYSGTVQEIAIELKARTINTRPYDVDAATVAMYYTDATIANFETETASAAAKITPKKMWDGYFLQGEGLGDITMGYGHIRTIASADAKYNPTGVDYSAAAGKEVQAANGGVVVYSGIMELTGYTVIIDHGFGLKTWYYHMSEASVKEGATVKRGDVIGKTGKTGLTSQNGVHIGMSVCNVFVCPYSTWSDGAWQDIPMYNG